MPHLSEDWQNIALTDSTTLASLAHLLARLAPISRPAIIDMRELHYPDSGVLLAIIGWTAERKRLKEATKFRLPASDLGRAMLRKLNFEYGFQSSVRESLAAYACDDSKDFFETSGRISTGASLSPAAMMISEAGLSLQDRGYFQFRSWDGDFIHPRINLPELRNELSAQELRWADELLVSLLSRRLGRENAGYVGSHIIYEALSNAFRHANSQYIVSAEQVYDAPISGRPAVLRLAFWDNGTPVQETLRQSLVAGRNIVNPNGRQLDVRFHRTSGTIYSLDEVSPKLKQEYAEDILGADLLLAAFLPGVTSEPDGFGAVYHPLLARAYPLLAAPGKGLFNMLNATCTFFGGKLTAWSGGQAAIFSVYDGPESPPLAKNSYAFSVTIEDLPSRDYRGNLVAIELPLQM